MAEAQKKGSNKKIILAVVIVIALVVVFAGVYVVFSPKAEEGSKAYTVEVIDSWEMTRETVFEGVNGKVTVPLPSKEGMAIMAVKMV